MRRIVTLVTALLWLISLGLTPAAAETGSATEASPARTGSLLIVGGGGTPKSIVREFRRLGGAGDMHLVIVPSADRRASKRGTELAASWRSAGVPRVTILHAQSRREANARAVGDALRSATAVWFGGGAQSRLARRYRGTRFERELHALLARGGVIAGSSAGAAIMTDIMIMRGKTRPVIGRGFDLFPGAIVDQHFFRRKRQQRLRTAVGKHPSKIGFGIAEATALIVTGDSLRVVGSGDVLAVSAHRRDAAGELRLRAGSSTTLKAVRRALTKSSVRAMPALATLDGAVGKAFVRGDVRPRRAARLVGEARAVYADVTRRLFPDRSEAPAGAPFQILLFDRTRTYRQFLRAMGKGGMRTNNGVYFGGSRIALANLGRSVGNLRHELTHALIGADHKRIPPWLNEGIASLYGTASRQRTGEYRFRLNYRLRPVKAALRRGTLPSLSDIAHSTRADFRGPRAALWYGVSRYLMMYLDDRGEMRPLYDAIKAAKKTPAARLAVLQARVDYRDFVRWLNGLPRSRATR